MNLAELKAGSELYELGAEQGWSQDTWLAVLHEFITIKQRNVELLAYAKEVAAEE